MKTEYARDSLYTVKQESVERFTFDQDVVRVFPDMIRRSVPGYVTLVSLIGIVGAKFAQAHTNIYDLGCSQGAVSASIMSNLSKGNCNVIAVDNSDAMLNDCCKNLHQYGSKANIQTILSDIREIEINNASVVALNYTLQFIPIEERVDLLQTIYNGLNPGGVLILSEKLSAESSVEQELISNLHLDFKQANGYTDLEIAQKRTALENVLLSETYETHHQRLQDVGFSTIYHWFQCLNFHSILAIK